MLLKVKNGTIHFYDDDRLLVSYAQAEGKHQLVGNPSFYEALKADKELQRRKYGHAKGKAIRKETALQGLGIPLHDGAARFYKEAGLLR